MIVEAESGIGIGSERRLHLGLRDAIPSWARSPRRSVARPRAYDRTTLASEMACRMHNLLSRRTVTEGDQPFRIAGPLHHLRQLERHVPGMTYDVSYNCEAAEGTK